MSNIKELIISDNDSLSFGDFSLEEKTKLSDFPFEGASYKVKTFKEITRLEKNGSVLFESVPGSAVHGFNDDGKEITFKIESSDDVEITLGLLETESLYRVYVNENSIGVMESNLGGKISFSIELNAGGTAKVRVVRL